jgi:cytochrome P450
MSDPTIIPPTKPRKEHKGIRLMRDVQRDPLGYFTNMMNQEGPYVWTNLGGQRLLVLFDATGIEHIMQNNASNYRKGSFNKVLKPLLGNGIFLSEGSVWRDQRRESAPVFAGGNYTDMVEQMVAATDEMFKRWQPRINQGQPIDMTVEMMQLTLDILLRALFHESRDGIAAQMQKQLGVLLGEAEGRIWSAVNLPQSFVLSLPKYRKATQFVRDIVYELITARRENREYPADLLSRLVASYGDTKSDQEKLRDQVMSFMLAGHETTAHGLSWTLYNLGLHLSEQNRMVGEVDAQLQGETPALGNLRKLPYTGQVFEESLRLYPPVWTMSREALQDDLIPLDDGSKVVFPKGTAAMLCGYAVQRREAYWEDPEAFNPERFSAEAINARPKFATFPFGGGPRVCLGQNFAKMEAVVVLAMMAQRFKISLLPGQKIEPQPIITLRPNNPILCRVKEREAVLPAQSGRKSGVDKCPFHHS